MTLYSMILSYLFRILTRSGCRSGGMLAENFGDLFNNRTGLEVFGNIKRNYYFELVYVMG